MIVRTFTQLDQLDESRIAELLSQFPKEQADYVMQMHHLQGQRERTAAYQLLKETLQEIYPEGPLPRIGHGEHGQPFLTNYPNLHFSQSHCKRIVAIALNENGPIGIDVESRRKVTPSLIAKVCNEEEQLLIAQSNDPELEFLRIWTRKEAYVKYLGIGIQDDLKNIDSEASAANLTIESHFIPESESYLSICNKEK